MCLYRGAQSPASSASTASPPEGRGEVPPERPSETRQGVNAVDQFASGSGSVSIRHTLTSIYFESYGLMSPERGYCVKHVYTIRFDMVFGYAIRIGMVFKLGALPI